ncbi:hypothetical protein G6L37_35010 [Agrobacterium rubi]|nr:hypothetical protein [Agrobacterium rubi]NTF23780.1 hypothetical protein [Agrobacterium rubi]
MKPTEIYALTTEHAENLHWASQELLQDVFEIDGLRHFDFDDHGEPDAETDLMLHRKLSMHVDSNNWVSLHTLEFKGVPFAVVNHLGTDHSGNTNDAYVTDAATYEAARNWLLSLMNKSLDAGSLVDPGKELELDFKGAELALVRGVPRLVPHSHVGLHTGVAIFDEKLLVDRFNDEIRPLTGTDEFKKGLHSFAMADRALDIIRSAMVADRTVDVGELANQNTWLSGFFLADGETYVARVVVRPIDQRPSYWFDDVWIKRVGFAPMFDLVEEFHRNARVDVTTDAARNYAETFGLTDEETSIAIGRVAQTGWDFLTAAVNEIRKREIVPPGFDLEDEQWVHARLLTETPMVARYGLGRAPSLNYAEQMWERWQVIQRTKAVDVDAGSAPV